MGSDQERIVRRFFCVGYPRGCGCGCCCGCCFCYVCSTFAAVVRAAAMSGGFQRLGEVGTPLNGFQTTYSTCSTNQAAREVLETTYCNRLRGRAPGRSPPYPTLTCLVSSRYVHTGTNVGTHASTHARLQSARPRREGEDGFSHCTNLYDPLFTHASGFSYMYCTNLYDPLFTHASGHSKPKHI